MATPFDLMKMGSNCYKQGFMFANAAPKSFSLDNVIQPKQSMLSGSPLRRAMMNSESSGYSTEMDKDYQESSDLSIFETIGKDSSSEND